MLDGRRAPPHDGERLQDLMRQDARECHAEQQRRQQSCTNDCVEQEASLPLDFTLRFRQRQLLDRHVSSRINLDTVSFHPIRSICIGKTAVIPNKCRPIRARLAERRRLDGRRLGTIRAIDIPAVLPHKHGNAAPFEQPALFLHFMKIKHRPIGDIPNASERKMNGNWRCLRPELHGPALPAGTQIIQPRKNQPSKRREHEHRQECQHECHRDQPFAERHIPKVPEVHPPLPFPSFLSCYRETITIG